MNLEAEEACVKYFCALIALFVFLVEYFRSYPISVQPSSSS